jgi:two-component sensor histidine kinase
MQTPMFVKTQSAALGLLIILLGLAALLVVPIVVRQKVERLHSRIEEEAEPARIKIGEALEYAHEAQSQGFETYLRLELASRGSLSPEQTYNEIFDRWQTVTKDDRLIRIGGKVALEQWYAGKAALYTWFVRYGRHYDSLRDDEIKTADELFWKGIVHLRSAQGVVREAEDKMRQNVLDLSRAETIITIPMLIICLILAGLSWRSMRSLQQLWVRERETAAHLELAMRETNHRIKNNLQVIGSLVDMQRMEPGETVPKQALDEIVQQVRSVAAVHDFLSQEFHTEGVRTDRLLHKLVALITESARIEVALEAEALLLSVKQATALALIANELLLNSGKHGATQAQVRMKGEGMRARFQVVDNGPGFPPGFDPAANANLGIVLIETLVRHDLNGEAAYFSQAGAHVEIDFPLS